MFTKWTRIGRPTTFRRLLAVHGERAYHLACDFLGAPSQGGTGLGQAIVLFSLSFACAGRRQKTIVCPTAPSHRLFNPVTPMSITASLSGQMMLRGGRQAISGPTIAVSSHPRSAVGLGLNADRHPTKCRVGYSPTAVSPGCPETGERPPDAVAAESLPVKNVLPQRPRTCNQ